MNTWMGELENVLKAIESGSRWNPFAFTPLEPYKRCRMHLN